MTILNDEDEEQEEQDQFNGSGFLSIGNDYFSNKEAASSNGIEEDQTNSGEPYDLRYHHTFASLPVDQTHFSTSNRSKVSAPISH